MHTFMCMHFPVILTVVFGHMFICRDFFGRISRTQLDEGCYEALTIGLE